MNTEAIFERTKKITNFTYTNKTATERAWVIKTMKQYLDKYDRPHFTDESSVAFAWYALTAAYRVLEDLKDYANTRH